MIGSTIGSFVLAGVMTAFLMLGRSGKRLYNYAGMEVEARRAMEEFSQDARMANAITWNSSSSVTLTVPDNYPANANQVTYAYDSATSGSTARCFYRRPGNATSTASAQILVRNVESCTYDRWDRVGAAATTDPATKRLDVRLRLRTVSTTTVDATENIVSSTYLLRNKVTN